MNKTATEIELEPLIEQTQGGRTIAASPLPFLEAVPVTVSVRVGRTEVSVAELVALKEGSVLSLDALLDEPLDILVSSHVVARGTLVAVGDHFGVRICEVAGTGGPARG